MGATGIHAVNVTGGTVGPTATSTGPGVQAIGPIPTPSYPTGASLGVDYDAWINGILLSDIKKACITSLEVKETVDGADSCTLKISDPLFVFLEDNLYVQDNPIKVQMGWEGVTYRTTFEGFISVVAVAFEADGIPKLTITCMDNTHKMNREKKNNTYSNTTSAAVVQQKAAEYGFKCVVEEGYAFSLQETITQSDQTDIEFLTKLAGEEVYPFTCTLVGDTIYYIKKGHLTDPPKMTLTYRDYPHEVVSFSPSLNKESKKDKVSKAKVNGSDKSVEVSTLESAANVGTASSTGAGNSSISQNYVSSGGSKSSGGTATYNPYANGGTGNSWTHSS